MVTLQRASVEHGKKCRAVEGRKTHRRRAAESPCGRAQARQPRTTFYPLFPPPLKKSTGLPLSAAKNAVRLEGRAGFTHRRRAAKSPCGRAQARQSRTTFSSLLPFPYEIKIFVSIRVHSWFKNVFRVFRVFRGFPTSTSGDARRNRRAGAPKRANHALPSTLFSLLP